MKYLNLIYKCSLTIILFVTFSCNDKKTQKLNIDSLYPKESLKIKFHNQYAVKHYPKRIKAFKKEPLNFGDIVFLGNSITEGAGNWKNKLHIQNTKNRGIGGDNTDGVLARLNEIIYYKPSKVFLLIGINDLDNLVYQKQTPSVEYVGNNILKIAKTIHNESPSTKIYIQTILPTLDSLLKDPVQKLNTFIKNNVTKNTFEIIDLHEAFLYNNNVKKELFRDHIHLNRKGYRLWADVLKPYLN